MNINFSLKNALKKTREQYVKEFKVSGEIKIEPCEKFVACLDKLSKNYVLALRDGANIETLQIANQNDIEFFEGYELTPQLTNDLRKKLCFKITDAYGMLLHLISMFNEFEKGVHGDTKNAVNDIKLDFSALKSIIKNIYQHLTMSNNDLIFSFVT